MPRGFTKALILCINLLFFADLSALQSEPTMDRRGLLGVVLDGQYMPFNGDSRMPVGVRIEEVQPGLAADRANLRNGDIVLSVNDQSVSSVRELQVAIASKKPGSKVVLTLQRDEEIFMRPVVLGDWFDFLVRTPIFGPFAADVSLRPITEADRQILNLPAEMVGLLVDEISDRSLYQSVFSEGTVITAVNGVDLLSESVLFRSLNEAGNIYHYFYNGNYGSFSLLKE